MQRLLCTTLAFLLSLVHLNGWAQFVELSSEEQAWINANPALKLGYDPEWKPLEFVDSKGKHSGIAADFLELVTIKTGLNIVPVKDITWQASVDSIKQGSIHLLACLASNEEREEFLDFTDAYVEYPFVIVVDNKSDFVGSLADLSNKKLALPKGYFITNQIQKTYPDLDLILCKDVESALMYVSTGQADATVANLGVIGYYLNYEGYQNLKISADTDFDKLKLRMAVPKGEQVLLGILNKALNSVSPEEKAVILQEWGSVKYEHGVDMAKVWRMVGISALVILLIILGIVYWNRTLKKEVNMRKEAEEKLSKSFEEIQLQKEIIELKNHELTDSITYAKRIQEVILPTQQEMRQHLSDHFVLYEPKDIVAGDFYWLQDAKDSVLFAACDCTGHGVPGAMVSVVCSNALNKAVKEEGIFEPAKILDRAREIVLGRLANHENNLRDGMDASICSLNKQTNELIWAGANNPLWIIRKETGELEEIKGDKQPVGAYAKASPFTSHQVQLYEGDKLFIFTDGYPDQFGGLKGKKLKSSVFKKLLQQLSGSDMDQIKKDLQEHLKEWMGEYEQLDDICVIGVRI